VVAGRNEASLHTAKEPNEKCKRGGSINANKAPVVEHHLVVAQKSEKEQAKKDAKGEAKETNEKESDEQQKPAVAATPNAFTF
jgi:hypothetical protein